MSITKQQAEEIKKRAQEFAAYGTGADRMRLYDYIDSITEPAAGQEALSPAPAQASVERDAARLTPITPEVYSQWRFLRELRMPAMYADRLHKLLEWLDPVVEGAAIAAQHGEGNSNG